MRMGTTDFFEPNVWLTATMLQCVRLPPEVCKPERCKYFQHVFVVEKLRRHGRSSSKHCTLNLIRPTWRVNHYLAGGVDE